MSITEKELSNYRSYYCIVIYIQNGGMPLYYCGYYYKYGLPVISTTFEEALKLNTRDEAQRILSGMKRPEFKIEEHGLYI
jgi:hypothetical protein